MHRLRTTALWHVSHGLVIIHTDRFNSIFWILSKYRNRMHSHTTASFDFVFILAFIGSADCFAFPLNRESCFHSHCVLFMISVISSAIPLPSVILMWWWPRRAFKSIIIESRLIPLSWYFKLLLWFILFRVNYVFRLIRIALYYYRRRIKRKYMPNSSRCSKNCDKENNRRRNLWTSIAYRYAIIWRLDMTKAIPSTMFHFVCGLMFVFMPVYWIENEFSTRMWM